MKTSTSTINVANHRAKCGGKYTLAYLATPGVIYASVSGPGGGGGGGGKYASVYCLGVGQIIGGGGICWNTVRR